MQDIDYKLTNLIKTIPLYDIDIYSDIIVKNKHMELPKQGSNDILIIIKF